MAIGSITSAHVTYNDNAPTVAVPSGAVEGNVYALFWSNLSHGATLTWPDGFTEVSDLAHEASFGVDMRCALRAATGSESGSFTGSTTSWQHWRTVCAVITGVSATPDDAGGNGTYAYASSASLTGASITTTGADRVILWAAATLSGGSAATPTLTPPAGLTTDTVIDFGNGSTIALADGTQASAGSATYSGSMGFGGVDDSRSGLILTIALAQSGGGGSSQTLAVTLADVTVAVAQTLEHPQSLAVTLADVTVAVAQEVTGSVSQALAVTLADVAVAAAQTLGHPQSLAVTLADVTVAVAQTLRHPQSLAVTLADVTVSIAQVSGGATGFVDLSASTLVRVTPVSTLAHTIQMSTLTDANAYSTLEAA